jgi:hypothetical protein
MKKIRLPPPASNHAATILICLSITLPCSALDVNVRDAPYNATGNGTTNDRVAIQNAINAVIAANGGTVTVPAGTYLTGDLQLGSHVTFVIAQNATLVQSQNQDDYAHRPTLGRWRNAAGINWDGWACQNYPLIYAGSGCRNVKITGTGTIRKTYAGDDNTSIHNFCIAFFDVDTFEISNITITNLTSYAMHPIRCRTGLISNVHITNPLSCCYNSDGVSLNNCQNVRVTGCDMTDRDDGIYVWSSYADPRRSAWWNTDTPQPSCNIEIDHNNVIQETNGSGFSFFPWGAGAPDPRLVEISNVNVHDNNLTGGASWGAACRLQLAGVTGNSNSPMKDITFSNNTYSAGAYGTINFDNGFIITNFNPDFNLHSPSAFQNAGFENQGHCYWSLRPNTDPASAGAKNDAVGQTGSWYGFIDKLDKGDARIFEGLYLTTGTYDFSARVQSSGVDAFLSVRKGANDSLMAGLICSNTAWQSKKFTFRVSAAGNYLLGLERGNATSGWARMDDASIGAGTGTPIGPPASGPDVTPPQIISANAADSVHVTIEFSESVDQQDAEKAANYAIDRGITINSAILQSNLATVILTTSQLTRDISYTLTINAIRDRATQPNTIAANSKTAFQYSNGLTKIRYYPRTGWSSRMTGGVFEGTNGDKDAGPYTVISTIIAQPAENQWTEVTSLSNANQGFRYVRYRSPANSYANVAEIEFYRGATKLAGPLFGTAGSWNNSGNDYTRAFDGNTVTFWDYSQSDGGYAGMDLQSGATINRIARKDRGFKNDGIAVSVKEGRIIIANLDAGAMLSVYDTRGNMVLSSGVVSGMNIGTGIVLPAGRYLLRSTAKGRDEKQSVVVVR